MLGATALDFNGPTSNKDLSDDIQKRNNAGEVDILISQVLDLLPNLGEGFVQSCLEYFDNSPEQVINTLLEENLPPHLSKLDRNLPKQVPLKTLSNTISHEEHQKLQNQEDIASTRKNIYDGDEFDINIHDTVDISRIHRGKQRRAKNANALLDEGS